MFDFDAPPDGAPDDEPADDRRRAPSPSGESEASEWSDVSSNGSEQWADEEIAEVMDTDGEDEDAPELESEEDDLGSDMGDGPERFEERAAHMELLREDIDAVMRGDDERTVAGSYLDGESMAIGPLLALSAGDAAYAFALFVLALRLYHHLDMRGCKMLLKGARATYRTPLPQTVETLQTLVLGAAPIRRFVSCVNCFSMYLPELGKRGPARCLRMLASGLRNLVQCRTALFDPPSASALRPRCIVPVGNIKEQLASILTRTWAERKAYAQLRSVREARGTPQDLLLGSLARSLVDESGRPFFDGNLRRVGFVVGFDGFSAKTSVSGKSNSTALLTMNLACLPMSLR